MLRIVAALLTAVLMTAPSSGWAAQDDPRLPAMFERLKTDLSEADARAVEAGIWSIWMDYTGEDDDVRIIFSQGLGAMGAGDLGRALAAFDRVVEAAPDFAEGWNKRATVRYLMNDYDGSIADVERTLALEPRHFGALSGLGLIHADTGDLPAALKAFEAALAIHPHAATVRANAEAIRRKSGGRPI